MSALDFELTGLVSRRNGGAAPVAIDLAAYGVGWDPGIGVMRLGPGQYAPGLEYADHLAAFLATTTIKTVYTDPAATGGDGSAAAPYTNIGNAWRLTPAEATLRIKAKGNAKGILWGGRGITGGSGIPLRNIIIEEASGGELIVFNCALTEAPAVTSNGDDTWSMRSGTNANTTSPAVDWSPAARAEHVDRLGRAFTVTTGTAALDAGARAALQPGQGYKQTGIGATAGDLDFTFRPFGDRPQASWDGYVCPPCATGNGMALTIDDTTGDSPCFFVDRVLVSGGTPFIWTNRCTTAGGLPRVYLNRCGAVGSTDCGLQQVARSLLMTYDWRSDATWTCGLRASNGNAAFLAGQPLTVHVRPTVAFAGLSASGGSNQTVDNDSRTLTLMPAYRGGNGRTIAVSDSGAATVLGGAIGPSVRTQAQGGYETLAGGSAARLVLAEGAVAASTLGNIDIIAESTAQVRCYGMTRGALRTSGDVAFAGMI